MILVGCVSLVHSIVNNESLIEPIVIFACIFVNAIMGFVQEMKSENAIESLKTMTSSKVQVKRDGVWVEIDASELVEGDVGEVIKMCLCDGLSPSIFFDMLVVNGGEVVKGYMDWERMTFTSYYPVRSLASYIGIYLDMNYVHTMLANKRGFEKDRVTESKHPNSRQAVAERGEEVK